MYPVPAGSAAVVDHTSGHNPTRRLPTENPSANLSAYLTDVPENMTHINKQQAEAIADALLAPRTAELDAARIQRGQQDGKARALQQKKRSVAALALITGSIGIAIAHYSGQALTQGFLYGALPGAGIGWLAGALRRRPSGN